MPRRSNTLPMEIRDPGQTFMPWVQRFTAASPEFFRRIPSNGFTAIRSNALRAWHLHFPCHRTGDSEGAQHPYGRPLHEHGGLYLRAERGCCNCIGTIAIPRINGKRTAAIFRRGVFPTFHIFCCPVGTSETKSASGSRSWRRFGRGSRPRPLFAPFRKVRKKYQLHKLCFVHESFFCICTSRFGYADALSNPARAGSRRTGRSFFRRFKRQHRYGSCHL